MGADLTASQGVQPGRRRFLGIAALLSATLAALSLRYLPVLSFVFCLFLGAFVGTAAFSTYLIPRLWKLATQAATQRIRWAFHLHALRGFLIVVLGVALLLVPLDIAAGLLLEFVVALAPILAVAIPLTSVAIFVLTRNHPDAAGFRTHLVVRVSRVLTAGCWLVAAVIVAATVQVFQLWPVSLRDGPDTFHAKAGFEQTLGFAPPPSVSGIYFRQFLFWQTNDVHIKFAYRDPAVVEQVVASLDMEGSEQPRAEWRIDDHFPSRWLAEGRQTPQPLPEYYTGRGDWGARRNLWVDREARLVYYLAMH